MPVLPAPPEADLRQGHNGRDFLDKVGVTLEKKQGGDREGRQSKPRLRFFTCCS